MKVLSKSCNFSDLEGSLLRYKIVCGVISEHTRRKLLSETNLNMTCTKALNICKADVNTTSIRIASQRMQRRTPFTVLKLLVMQTLSDSTTTT